MSATATTPFVMPTSGTIHIKPKEGAKVVGPSTFSGDLVDVLGNAHKFKGKKVFSIPGEGVILALAKESDRKTYAILLSKVLKPWFSKNAKFRYRFEIVDLIKDADDYLRNDEMKTDYKAQVMKLKPTELKTIGFMFRLGNEEKMIKSGLYKMIDDKKTCAKIGTFLLNADKKLLFYVYYGLKVGDSATKTGLYKNERDLFFFNDTVIGLGEEVLLAYLKKDTDDATSIYELLKGQYEEALAKE